MENSFHSAKENFTDMDRKTLYQIYTNYIDPSEITLRHYLQKNFHTGQEQYFHKLNKWLEEDDEENHKPLVFKTKEGAGIKTIFSNWHNQISINNMNKKEKYLNIIHFASNGNNNKNYFYCLYRIIIKLREALKLKQSVDLLQEKIRKYFAYWLDIANSEVQRQKVIYCSEEIYNKIVIIIEGIDQFVDMQSGKEANIAFWLPKMFPKHIKVVCSVSEGSQAYDYFEKNGCEIINLELSQSLMIQMYSQSNSRRSILNSQTEKLMKEKLNSLCEKEKLGQQIYRLIDTFTAFFLPEKYSKESTKKVLKNVLQNRVTKETFSKINNLQDLVNTILEIWQENFPGKKRIKECLIYLSISQKGLTLKQILQLSQFSEKQWMLFCEIFDFFILKFQKIYSIKSRFFIRILISNEKQSSLLKYHEKIAESLEATGNSIRKLQEQTYHLFISKSYFKLKEIVSNIQNFLLLFNQNNKYQLSRYWQKLEEKGFDPVIQYNKAVEGFSMHYHPSDQNIFRIIVQISKFLKEFCDFETYKTPNFRHPFIEGNMTELQKIGLLKEFANLDIYVDNSFNTVEETDKIIDCPLQEQIILIRQKYFPKNIELQNMSQVIENIKANNSEIENDTNLKIRKKANMKILSDIEQLNVDVPMNRQKFRKYYLQTLEEFIQREQYQQCKNQNGFFEVYLKDEDDYSVNSFNTSPNCQEYSFTKVRENYRMRKINPSLYYYKRWIWIQFPWVCISLNNNYSNTPELCRSFETDEFETLEQQTKYTKQALIVAIEAKEKKKQMFNKKNQTVNGFQTSTFNRTTKSNIFVGSGFSSGSRFGEKSAIRSRVINKNSSNIDLNLNTLTKELQERKKDLENYTTPQEQLFLSEIQDNHQEDMKFISQRKPFQIPQIKGMASDQILPKLKWTIKEHTSYEINYIKQHIEQKRKKLNKIIYTNKKLTETYKELKMKQNLTKKNLHEQEQQKNSRKHKIIDDLNHKKEQVINDFCKSLLQEQRLKIVLKLCSENKTRNQQYLASLNYFLQSLKKMINWEKQNIKSITKQMNGIKLMKEKQLMMESEKQKNQQILQRQAEKYLEQKEKIQMQIVNISNTIEEDINNQKNRLENSLTGHLKNRQQKDILMLQEKKAKQLQEKLQTLQEQYQALKQLFDLDGLNFQKSQKFRQLLEENEKNKKLKILYFEQKNKLQIAQKSLEQTKEKYEQYKESSLLGKKKGVFIQSSEERRREQLNEKMENKLKIFIDNVMLKLGLNAPQDIIPSLQEKLKELKANNSGRYSQIISTGREKSVHI